MTRVLITYGGTVEAIDDVRSIRNESSGKLGALIAETFTNHNFEVYTIHSKFAQSTHSTKIREVVANSVLEVDQAIQTAMLEFQPHVVIHAMAISDFTVHGVFDYATIKNSVQEDDLSLDSVSEGKIHADAIKYVRLEPAPKLIQKYKQMNPNVLLIGFKLLAQANDAELLEAAQHQMLRAHSDLVVCNHLEKVGPEKHEAMLVSADQDPIHCTTKIDIANKLMAYVQKEII